MTYKLTSKTILSFDGAVEKIKSELAKEGFGVLTEVDVKKTLKKKLNVDYENYIILGACNPSFAFKALELEKEIGLLLPCNVIVYVDNGGTYVSAINPVEAMSVAGNLELKEIAEEVGKKLKRVVESFSSFKSEEMKGGENGIIKKEM